MTRDEVERLVWTLHERDARWPGIVPDSRRWTNMVNTWASSLVSCQLDDVKRCVSLARQAGRVERVTPKWLIDQCAHFARNRAFAAQTPVVECEACRRLPGGRLCADHCQIGKANIARIRAEHGWPTPAETAAIEAANYRNATGRPG